MPDENDTFPCEPDLHDPLRALLQGTASETGEHFSGCGLQSPFQALGTRFAWVKKYVERLRRMKPLAFCMDRRLQAPFGIEIEGAL